MDMDMDMSVYLGAFLDEVDEQLQILEEEVLNLEQDGENIETIQKIFRAAHTLKGSSAAMGMDKMKGLTHKVENVFDAIRNQQLKVDTQIINLIFDSIDTIKSLKEAILNSTLDAVDVSDLVARLEAAKNTSGETSAPVVPTQPQQQREDSTIFPEVLFDEYQKDMVEKAFEIGMNVVAVYVSLNDKTTLKSVRAFLINNNLKEVGEIIATYPSTEIIEDEAIFEGNLVYILITQSQSQELLAVVNGISDIRGVHLTFVTPDNLQSFCEGKKMGVVEQKAPKAEDVTTGSQKNDAKLKVQQTVRVDVDRLESLINLVGELVISQTRLTDVRMRLAERYPNESQLESFHEVENQLGHIVSELQEGLMKTRMLPIEQLFNRFPRMVRDIAQKAGKEIDFVLQGKETELDRNLIEEIADPIIHLLRNSLDHGVESPEERELLGKPRQGKVVLRAAHEENHIVITISDDGRGIDAEKIKQAAIRKQQITEAEAERMTDKDLVMLIFKSGVSTAKQVTDISGRGVGMDIVRSHIEKLNGLIDIDTKLGEGTVFSIKLPLTLAIIRSLLIQLGDKHFAMPLANVQEIIRLGQDEIKTIQNQEVGIVRDRILPLVRMHERLGTNEDNIVNKKRLLVVVVGLAEKRVGIVIDRTLGNQEIVIKPLGKYMGDTKYIAGATIMGNGTVALILDVGTIVLEEGLNDSDTHEEDKKIVRDEQLIGVTSFNLGDEEYGIEIDKVQDIITVPSISPIINSPFSIVGMSNFRGKLISVMDLRKRLGLPEEPLSRKSRIIVVKIKNELLGLLVDQVTQVLKIDENDMGNAPNHESQIDQAFIHGIYHFENRLMMLLNIDEIIEMDKLLQLNEQLLLSE